MFDTPNWLGSFITSQTNKDLNDLNRKHEVMMEDIKHKHEYLIQKSRNVSNESIAKANRESTEEIARLNRMNEAEIAAAKNKNAISVALINAASQTIGRNMPYILPAFLAGKASKSNNTNDKGSNSNKPTSSAQAVHVTKSEVEADEAKKRADNLFPELEPTFGVTLMNGDELSKLNSRSLPTINVTQLVPAIGAVLTIAAPLLAI